MNDAEYIEELLYPIRDIIDDTNARVIGVIIRRIANIGELTATDALSLSAITKTKDLKEIEKIIAEGTQKTIEEIDNIILQAAARNDMLAEQYFNYREMTPQTIVENAELMSVADYAKKNIVDEVLKMSKTTVLSYNKKNVSIDKAYNAIVNKAIYEVSQGTLNFDTAMASVVKELSDNGFKTVDYESGYSRRLDSAVAQNIRDGVNQLNINYREFQGKEYGADGVEIDAHALCAPDHLPIQGRQFTTEQFERLQNTLERPIGTNNCTHGITKIIIGVNEPAYNERELKELADLSNQEVTYDLQLKDENGKPLKKTLSRYEFTQAQRRVETELRTLKARKSAIAETGSKEELAKVNKQIRDKSAYYKKISDQAGIKPKPKNTTYKG